MFFLVFKYIFYFCFYLGFWGVEGALCKILELLCQYPQRNYLSKSATFDPIFQLLHSALWHCPCNIAGRMFQECVRYFFQILDMRSGWTIFCQPVLASLPLSRRRRNIFLCSQISAGPHQWPTRSNQNKIETLKYIETV